ncbi:MAG: SIR2 family protein [Propionibacteriaceae bacterium]|nr:SIR2 family protein [Propionibacteriaceae bacterium]
MTPPSGRPRGHVFVTVANINHLQVDAWLLPTDRYLSITPKWEIADHEVEVLRAADSLQAFRAGTVLAAPWPESPQGPLPDGPQGPLRVLTAVPPRGARDFSDLQERLEAGLRMAAEAARARRNDGRLPLIATPAFGVSGGGANRRRADVIAGILRTADLVAHEEGVDVVVCLWKRVDYALAQHIRRAQWKSQRPLETALWDRAVTLAEHTRKGDLVPFMGAGVSATAGLPTWAELLQKLQITGKEIPDGWLKDLGSLDIATILESKYPNPARFTKEVARLVRSDRYGLAPALLANLPGTSAVTLNYDRLYEAAWSDAWHDTTKPLRVLPWDSLKPSEPWLLKLHGDVGRPKSIILTRSQYLDFAVRQRGLASLAKALLMTKHLLFVGFGLSDDHFHEIVHEVRGIRPEPKRSGTTPARSGTALVLGDGGIHAAVWGNDFDIVPFSTTDATPDHVVAGRKLEIFLDVMVGLSGSDEPFTLDPRFQDAVDDRTLQSATRLSAAYEQLVEEQLGDTSPARRLRQLLLEFGYRGPT